MKLFWRIFLSFWIATLLMLALVLTVNELATSNFPGDDGRLFQPDVMLADLTLAVNAYEHQGPAAFRSQTQRLPMTRHAEAYLFDQQGTPLLTGGSERAYASRAQDVLRSGHSEFIWLGLRALYICTLTSSSGQRYAVVLIIFSPTDRLWNPRFWSNLAIAMLPAAFVCALLTLYLIRPITKLQTAAQRLADGELDARAGPLKVGRRDELGDLSRDFNRMASQIQLLMTAQRRFVSDVSHELGAPLTRMHLALALLRREYGARSSNALVRIERETDKLSKLVQQLLLLAGLEAGRILSETLVPISIRSLCDSIVEDGNFEAAQDGRHIVVSLEDITLLAYPNLLRRAIDNVLRNAIRYSPPGAEIQLNCTVDTIEREVIVDILDQGPGVAQAELVDIFQPFFRTSPGRESSSGGTGLGLAIAHEAVRLHDGTIKAHNRANGGLHVRISLPLRIPMPEEE